jgi:hypothetical protein
MAIEVFEAYATEDFQLMESKAKEGWNSALFRRLEK